MKNENRVIRDFGEEWERFNFLDKDKIEALEEQFRRYTSSLPDKFLERRNLIIADFGAGTGRWSHFLKEYSSQVYAVEPATKAFQVLSTRFANDSKFILLNESVQSNQIPEKSLDLAVSLGVLHHIVDTQTAINKVIEKIKPGGVFLGYLYYALENKPVLYRGIWKASNSIRKVTSRLPTKIKLLVSECIALSIYLPLSRLAFIVDKLNGPVELIPLHHYKNLSFHVMRNDALDRFGTTLERRFNQDEILQLLVTAGFERETIRFSNEEPFWTFSASVPINA
jgi:SAM-dependent methyltransferase